MEEKQVLAEIQKQERQPSTYWRSLPWHVCAVLAAGTATAEILLFFVLVFLGVVLFCLCF